MERSQKDSFSTVESVFPVLTSLVSETLGIDEERVVPELSAETVDEWDSLNHLRLITAVEKRFDIRLSMEEVMSLASIGDLAQAVANHQSAK
jgi:acyl carrier protein